MDAPIEFINMTTSTTSPRDIINHNGEKEDTSESLLDTNSNVEPDDPCNSYEWSVMFLLILILASILITIEGCAMFKRRTDLFSGFDIGSIFLFGLFPTCFITFAKMFASLPFYSSSGSALAVK